jgi:hypothetical protein
MFSIAPLEGIIILSIFAVIGVQAFGIVDAAQRSSAEWQAARRSKTTWILLQLFFLPFASLAYLAFIRPRLKKSHVAAP